LISISSESPLVAVQQVIQLAKDTRRHGGTTVWDDPVWRDRIVKLYERTEAAMQNARRARVPALNGGAMRIPLQGKLVEPKLIQPTFIIDLPLAIWPLVKPVPEHQELLAAAFDGIVAGMEITGGGTDVNDPIEQRRHFVEQRERQEAGAEPTPHEHDEEFVRALEYGMLTASGSGLGVDRLMMILSGAQTLRDVILFPSMREAPGEGG